MNTPERELSQRERELDHIAKMLVRRDFELLQTSDILRIRDEQIAKEQELNRAKSEFVSLASHQLKTPLTIIKWYIEMLGAGYAGNSAKKQKEYLEKIYANTQRMVELVDAFLNVSRLELGVFSIKNEPLNLRNKMESILRDFAPKLKEKKLKLSQAYTKSSFTFSADAKMVQIIFENLISNAVKYTPHGGKIGVKMQKKGNEIYIGVEDTGIGIPVEQQPKIFTKFFRADNASSNKADGTGLGLYIVKTMVEKIGGKIWFESAENKGTIFYVAIPLK
ncbi:MAG: HAMP domain-containing sensor histidine kinase [bacterium]|nr:HAMP domain-containing sensor histidine kinase [bacterium]